MMIYMVLLKLAKPVLKHLTIIGDNLMLLLAI